MWRLRLVRGQSSPPLVRIRDHVTLGRAPEASVMVRDPAASRIHARVSIEEDGLWAIDLGSSNGTFSDGSRAERSRLVPGSHIRIGDTEFVVEEEDADAEPVPASPPPGPAAERRRPVPGSTLLRLAASAGPAAGTEVPEARELSEAVAREDDSVGRFRRFARGAASVASADVAFVLVRAAAGGPYLLAGRHPPEGTDEPPPIARAVLARVSRTGEAVLLTTDERSGRGEPGDPQSAGLAMCAPIGPQGDAGALVLAERRDSSRPFRAADLAPFATLAAQTAPSLGADLAWFRWRATFQPAAGAGRAPVLVGESPAFQRVLDVAEVFADSRGPVLIRGEPGSGRRTFAALLHSMSSARDRPHHCIPCAALPAGEETVAIFGEQSGARRRPGLLDDAGDGTLCLTGISDLAPAAWQPLAEALTQRRWHPVGGSVHVPLRARLIATTSRNLHELATRGEFHAGLVSVLSSVTLGIPALEERTGDVPLLAAHFATISGRRHRGRPVRLTERALRDLSMRKFPGQVAELAVLVEKAVLTTAGDELDAAAFELPAPVPLTEDLLLSTAERRAVERAMEATGGRRGEAAKRLGISGPTLKRRLREFGFDPPAG